MPCLWYTDKAEEAAAFYASVLPNSKVDSVTALPADSPSGPAGSVKVVEFTLMGQPFMAMSAGPLDPFNHAVSFAIECDDQREELADDPGKSGRKRGPPPRQERHQWSAERRASLAACLRRLRKLVCGRKGCAMPHKRGTSRRSQGATQVRLPALRSPHFHKGSMKTATGRRKQNLRAAKRWLFRWH